MAEAGSFPSDVSGLGPIVQRGKLEPRSNHDIRTASLSVGVSRPLFPPCPIFPLNNAHLIHSRHPNHGIRFPQSSAKRVPRATAQILKPQQNPCSISIPASPSFKVKMGQIALVYSWSERKRSVGSAWRKKMSVHPMEVPSIHLLGLRHVLAHLMRMSPV